MGGESLKVQFIHIPTDAEYTVDLDAAGIQTLLTLRQAKIRVSNGQGGYSTKNCKMIDSNFDVSGHEPILIVQMEG